MLNDLNADQISAVTSKNNTLVLACPGSGKTRVLTRKIAYELERLDSKKKFLIALTFTNRAAEEIQERVDELGIPQERLWAGTIHSFCYQWIIKPYSIAIPELVNGFSIIDEHKKQSLLNGFKEHHSLPYFKSINTSFNREGRYLDRDPIHKLIAEKFHQELLDNKEVDFDLLLYLSYKLLRKHQKIRKHLSGLISYIFVDEYQDTLDLQYGIIGEILRHNNRENKLFLVGDPDQAIYRSLGGESKSLEDIGCELGGEKIVQKVLSGNYRSTQRIVDFFRNFQLDNVSIDALGQHSKDEGLITLDQSIDKDELPKVFAELITYYLDKGVSPNEICVIAPQWYFLTSLAKKLKTILPEVPFDAPGLTPLPRSKENFWWKLSRLFLTEVTPKNSFNRFKWVKEIFEEINEYTNSSFAIEYNDCRKYLKLINSIEPNVSDGVSYLDLAFKEFFKVLEIDINTNKSLCDQQESFFEGIRSRYDTPEYRGVPRDVKYFKDMFRPSNGVVVNTCHGVKGEEFETVIAFGMLWGHIPHWNVVYNESKEVVSATSKNLLYVIGSRAKRNLHLFAERGRKTNRGFPLVINKDLATIKFKYDNLSDHPF